MRIIFDAAMLYLCLYWAWYVNFRKPRQDKGFKKLVAACFGDKEKAERLINAELKSGNAFGRNAGIKLALQKLQRDRSPT